MSSQRRGVSLIEVLIVIAILGVLIGLVLAGVQRARFASLRVQSKNNLRQIILATHQLAAQKDGKLDYLIEVRPAPSRMPGGFYTALHDRLLPFVRGPQAQLPANPTPSEINDFFAPEVKCYRNPADPSWEIAFADPLESNGKARYVYNHYALQGYIQFFSSI